MDLGEFTRREFLKASPALPMLVTPYGNQQVNRRNVFQRGSPYNINSLPIITSHLSRRQYALTAHEIDEQSKQIAQKDPFLRGKTLELVESYEERWVRLEPDAGFANGLIREARISIDDIVRFLNSPYIKKPTVEFRVPQLENDVTYVNVPERLFYLVADLGTVITTNYNFKLNGKIIPVRLTQSDDHLSNDVTAGETKRSVNFTATESGFAVQSSRPEPIFYNTSSNIVKLVETPPMEGLHTVMQAYTLNHIITAVKNTGRTYDALMQIVNKHLFWEEKFVHALSVLWWQGYRKQLGISQQELDARFAQYELHDKYKGTNQLSQRIARIGVQKAIDMYVKNPEALFKGA